MRLLAAVALSRPGSAVTIATIIARQQTKAEWLVVENGDAVGSFSGPATVRYSRRSAGAARNAALAYARENGFDWVSFFDDDDYYGPRYLAEVVEATGRGDADALHKGVGFVRFDDGLHLFDSPTRHVMANTLSVRVAVAPPFLELAEPEEPAWTQAASARGLRIRRLPPWNHVWNRTGDPASHIFKGGPPALRASFGPARRIGSASDAFVDRPRRVDGYQAASDPRADELFEDLERHARASFGWGN